MKRAKMSLFQLSRIFPILSTYLEEISSCKKMTNHGGRIFRKIIESQVTKNTLERMNNYENATLIRIRASTVAI